MARYTPKSPLQQSREVKGSPAPQVVSRPSIEVNIDPLMEQGEEQARQREEQAAELRAEQEAFSAFAPLSTPLPLEQSDNFVSDPEATMQLSIRFDDLQEMHVNRPAEGEQSNSPFTKVLFLLALILAGGFAWFISNGAPLTSLFSRNGPSLEGRISFGPLQLEGHEKGILIRGSITLVGEPLEAPLWLRWWLREGESFSLDQGRERCCVTLSGAPLEAALDRRRREGTPLPVTSPIWRMGHPQPFIFFVPNLSTERLALLQAEVAVEGAPALRVNARGSSTSPVGAPVPPESGPALR